MARASIELKTTMLTMLLLIHRDIEPLLLLLLRLFAYRRFLLMIVIQLMWQLRNCHYHQAAIQIERGINDR